MSKKSRWIEKFLAVADPIELKTEPGTEIVIAASPDELVEGETEGHWKGHHDEPATQRYRQREPHISGLGEVIEY